MGIQKLADFPIKFLYDTTIRKSLNVPTYSIHQSSALTMGQIAKPAFVRSSSYHWINLSSSFGPVRV